jgi:cobyrinic acid a,c-diamide synthase
VAAGRPTYAECAGLLLLCEELDGRRMVGHVPAEARMTERLTLGYRSAVAPHDTFVARAGTTVAAHEFHRTAVSPGAGERPAWLVDGVPHGFATRSTVASYLHLHPAGVPTLATGLVAAAREPALA